MEEIGDVSASAPAVRLKWDVFLSFRGEDTRDNITDRLYRALFSAGVRVFRDNDGLNQGDEINPGLLEAIEDSAAAIVILSRNYASSRWCLEELARVCELRRLVLPVFYRVDPSDVRRQIGPFEEGFKLLEGRFGVDNVARWRKAMERIGGTSGWVYHDRISDNLEQELIQSVVKRVLREVSNSPMVVTPFLVGRDFSVKEIMEILDVKRNGIRILVLHGIGGVGKTTLSKAVYNKLAKHFEHRVFIEKVRETVSRRGVLFLQEKLVNSFSQAKVSIDDISAGVVEIRQRLQRKRILLILDDVDDMKLLESLAGGREWFSEGSRIVITTRNKEILQSGIVTDTYEMRELGNPDSLILFSHHALRRETPSGDFVSLSKQIVSITGGLPLALELFGSFLVDKRQVEEWKDAIEKLKQVSLTPLQNVLKVSYDALDEEEKCVFLDMACLFLDLEMNKEDMVDAMRGCGFWAGVAITTLVTRSLVKVTENDGLWMHDSIRDMGRHIVLQEGILDKGKCSRLWDSDDVLSVLQGRKGTREIRGMILDLEQKKFSKIISAKRIAESQLQRAPKFSSVFTYLREVYKDHFKNDYSNKKGSDVTTVRSESFDPMVNLRLLQFSDVKVEGNLGKLPNSLRWFQWIKCPLRTFPCNFYPRELAVLDLSRSAIESVGSRKWSWNRRKETYRLKIMNLRDCYNITAVPDLSRHKVLEKLILEHCTSLKTIHKSIADLKTLRHLNLRGCSKLIKFPADVSGLKNLEILILSGCSKVKNLPENIGFMSALRELLVDETAIENLPESLFRLTKLERLCLDRCQSLKQLPRCIGKLSSLRDFSLYGSAVEELPDSIEFLGNLETLNLQCCKSITVIPSSVGNLQSLSNLYLSSSAIEFLPESIGSLYYLRALNVGSCALPDSIKGLSSMVELRIDTTKMTRLPYEIGALKSLKKLEMRNCKNLSSLPESIGNLLALNTLIITNSAITELPESIGMLQDLIVIRLNQCKQLCRLPSSIGNLKSLRRLIMEDTAVTALPETFGMISNLMVLRMGKKPYQQISHSTNTTLPSSFSRLSLLEEFDAHAWRISGKISDDFEELSSLETLNLSHNDFFRLPSSLRGLSLLKKLILSHCKSLISLPCLPSSLLELNAANCIALESMFDLSNLKDLQQLYLTNCDRLVDVPGIENMNCLRRLHMSGCTSCASVVASKLDKDAVKNLYSFSIPGNEIPNWFTRGEIRFANQRNNAIKGVIVSVVVSVNPEIPDDLRDELPVIPNIHAKILRLNKAVFTTAMYLSGVPRKSEANLYLCRFADYEPLVSVLENGDVLEVGMSESPIKGIELKKCGICLVFENDDDYEGTEESLEENQQSVSEKLTRFIGSSVVNGDHTSSSNARGGSQGQGWNLLGCIQEILCFLKNV